MLRATIARVALLSFLLGFTKYSTAEDKSKPAPIGSKADRTLLAVTTAEWGNLTGRFVYDPDAPKPECGDVKRSLGIIGGYQVVVVKDESLVVSDNGGVANVLIYVISQSIPTHPSYQATNSDKVLLDVQPWRFVPHVTTCRLSQAVILRNSTVHSQNFRIEPPGDMLINPLAPPECSIEHKFTVPQSTPVPVHNDIVPWMRAYLLPLDHPYVAVSQADGSFSIPNLPVGNWEFQVWHETPGLFNSQPWPKGRFTTTIKPGENNLGTIAVGK